MHLKPISRELKRELYTRLNRRLKKHRFVNEVIVLPTAGIGIERCFELSRANLLFSALCGLRMDCAN